MIDIGINLADKSFDHDRQQVIEEAQKSGVTFIIVTGSCSQSNQAAIQMSEQHPHFIRATAGIHPHHAQQVTASTMADVADCLNHPFVHAVGETGLDFYRDIADRQQQQIVFEQHLQLACEQKMPLFLHQREAHATFLPMIKTYRQDFTEAVVHCFTDSKKALFDYLDLGLHIGLTGWIADERRGTHLLELIKNIPTDRLMIETDGPYLLPRNIRPKPKSRRNEPKYLHFVAEKIAQTLGTNIEDVITNTTNTAQKFFHLPDHCRRTHQVDKG